jgi:hypothetical protein
LIRRSWRQTLLGWRRKFHKWINIQIILRSSYFKRIAKRTHKCKKIFSNRFKPKKIKSSNFKIPLNSERSLLKTLKNKMLKKLRHQTKFSLMRLCTKRRSNTLSKGKMRESSFQRFLGNYNLCSSSQWQIKLCSQRE